VRLSQVEGGSRTTKERKRWREFAKWVADKGPIWKHRLPVGFPIPREEMNALYIEAKLHRVNVNRRMFKGQRYTVYFTNEQENMMMYYLNKVIG